MLHEIVLDIIFRLQLCFLFTGTQQVFIQNISHQKIFCGQCGYYDLFYDARIQQKLVETLYENEPCLKYVIILAFKEAAHEK